MAGIFRSVTGNPKEFKTIVWDKRAVSFRKKTDRFFLLIDFFFRVIIIDNCKVVMMLFCILQFLKHIFPAFLC